MSATKSPFSIVKDCLTIVTIGCILAIGASIMSSLGDYLKQLLTNDICRQSRWMTLNNLDSARRKRKLDWDAFLMLVNPDNSCMRNCKRRSIEV